ncbi:hypothetical protein J21TS7_53250 [Paenibacillus cineris]|uniref:Uncharacterized protein n=1 Tax=Paenibacillus cineris TaxID=237530 RepID=A0ABQ4LKG3_9BACL|nr:hypothetical protein J21TS7_53250 [Paenibacillus cineris]
MQYQEAMALEFILSDIIRKRTNSPIREIRSLFQSFNHATPMKPRGIAQLLS